MNSPWVLVSERFPTEKETMAGRIPVIDEDGYLVIGLIIEGRYIMTTSDLDAVYWLPVGAPTEQ